MKKIDVFLEEIANNFSELLVETFFIRYFSVFSEKELFDSINKLEDLLNSKIKTNIIEKLLDYGYSQKDIDRKLN